MNKIKVEDILFFLGLAIIVMASFFVSTIIGLYVLGLSLGALGILIARR